MKVEVGEPDQTTAESLPKFVAAIATSGVGVGNCLMAGSELGVLKMVFGCWTIEVGAAFCIL